MLNVPTDQVEGSRVEPRRARQTIRRLLLNRKNPLGLIYTLYADSRLTLTQELLRKNLRRE